MLVFLRVNIGQKKNFVQNKKDLLKGEGSVHDKYLSCKLQTKGGSI